MSTTAATKIGPAGVRAVPLFADLDPEQLAWISEKMVVNETLPGDVIFAEGSPPNGLFILLNGELTLTRGVGDREEVLSRHRVGDLPDEDAPAATNSFFGEVQLLTGDPRVATATAGSPGRIGILDKATFDEMLVRCPEVARVMLPVLSWRIRAEEMRACEWGTLTALGTMAAGLTHELNNPTAAACRAAGEIDGAVEALERTATEWAEYGTGADLRALRPTRTHRALSGLASSQREDEITDWLGDRGHLPSGEDTGLLTDAGADIGWLEALVAKVGRAAIPLALRYTCALLKVESLTGDLRESVARVSALVDDVRTYTQLDRAPLQEVDLHAGIDSTLRLLSAKLTGITLRRDFALNLPRPLGRGAELNQVWTNIIDNALDAMAGSGQLLISTRGDGPQVAVEISDSGSGISPDIRSRLFEPFFTTKDIGKGTGLGLHIVYRIVTERHGGSIEIQSRPGQTRFIVRLPLQRRTVKTSIRPSLRGTNG